MAAINKANTMSNPAPLPTCRINSTGNSDTIVNATAPVEVNTHDFPSHARGKATPYGVYDVAANEGWVSVGISADTAQFAANSIASWWEHLGRTRYPKAEILTITAGHALLGAMNSCFDLSRFLTDAPGSPVRLTQSVKYGPADLTFGVRVELHIARGVEVVNSCQQPDYAGGNQIVQADALRQPVVNALGEPIDVVGLFERADREDVVVAFLQIDL